MDVLEAIRTRRSIRKFTNQGVADELVEKILTAGIWAPSGKNNQLWRFAVVKDPQFKAELAKLTKHTDILENAPVLILVFVDHTVTYDAVKDANSIGACVQNMLLAIHSLGLAAVWIAEILKNKDEVKGRCQAPDPYELMAVVALGYGAETGGQGTRNGLEDVVFLRK